MAAGPAAAVASRVRRILLARGAVLSPLWRRADPLRGYAHQRPRRPQPRALALCARFITARRTYRLQHLRRHRPPIGGALPPGGRFKILAPAAGRAAPARCYAGRRKSRHPPAALGTFTPLQPAPNIYLCFDFGL